MESKDRGSTDYGQHLKSAETENTRVPIDSNTPPSDSSPSTGGTVLRRRGGREISITVGKQSAFTEEGKLTTVPVAPDARGKPRPLQPMEMQIHLASQGLGDLQINKRATRQRFAIARNQDRRRPRRLK